MDNSKIQVSIVDLKNVLTSLKKQRDILNNEYKGSISSVLDSSQSCLGVAGLNTAVIKESFNNVFKNINTSLDALINVLENNVIKNYSELAEAIRKLFNNDFASKMNDLLGTNSSVIAPNTTSYSTADRVMGAFKNYKG